MEGVEMNHPEYADLRRAMMLRLDHDIAPGGYSWIFATGEDTAKVGICYIQNDRHREFAEAGKTVDGYLDDWIDRDPRFAEAEQIDETVHRGSAHIQRPGQMHTDSFIAIGDTVPSIDPLWGEGIHKGMKSARAAAATVDRCLTDSERRTDAESLAVYETLWHRDVAPRAKSRLALTELLYLAPNERYDRLLRDLQETDDDILARRTAARRRGWRGCFTSTTYRCWRSTRASGSTSEAVESGGRRRPNGFCRRETQSQSCSIMSDWRPTSARKRG